MQAMVAKIEIRPPRDIKDITAGDRRAKYVEPPTNQIFKFPEK